ncbi:MAG: DUF47 family protein [Nitrososphaerota archaeon]|nr:DUF47 family protein [Nitrososphaerota archaeon]MDG6930939.1 DUF47 family protein [Nitrososphaerota archaeon]
MSFTSLFKKGEDRLLEQILQYYLTLESCYDNLQKYLLEIKAGNGSDETYKIISDLEKKADENHEKLAESIASGSFFSYIRDDFLQLLEKMDYVADYSKDVAKIFKEYNIEPVSIQYLFDKTQFTDFTAAIKETLTSFEDVLRSVKKSPPNVLLVKVKNVEGNEEKADYIKDKVQISIHNNCKDLPVLDVITLRDIVNLLDNVADSAEDSSDIIIQLIAKGYK